MLVAKQSKNNLSIFVLNFSIFLLGLVVFMILSLNFDVTQDDAYISFRYAENYLSGKGLVYNYGEKVEGYTNFLWIIILIISKAIFGIDYLVASRFLGILCGELVLFLIFLISIEYFNKNSPLLYLSTLIVLLSNLSFIYWSGSSMETSAFACTVLLAIFMEKRMPMVSPAIAAVSTLIRPEGFLVFISILVYRLIFKKETVFCILMYSILMLPFAAFKWFYFGSLFPNTYFAKSGIGFEYCKSGFEYVWSYIKGPGVYGAIILPVLVTVRKLWKLHCPLYLYIIFYMVYIIVAGGDVLKAYRFFVPMVPVLSYMFVVSITELLRGLRIKPVNAIVLLCTLTYSMISCLQTYDYLRVSAKNELGLIKSMHFIGYMLKKHIGNDFSVATSTIGMLGYQLIGHRVIDVLGLTDAYIAKNPEKIEGIESSWKERRYNSYYLLKQQPDFIVFSTGYKPSAPAERALMMHSEFRRKYAPTGFVYRNVTYVIWKKVANVDLSKDVIYHDPQFVNKIVDALNNLYLANSPNRALMDFRESYARLGEDYPLILVGISSCFLAMNLIDSAAIYARKALQIDSTYWLGHVNMMTRALSIGDTITARLHLEVLKRHHPWLFDFSYQPTHDVRFTNPHEL